MAAWSPANGGSRRRPGRGVHAGAASLVCACALGLLVVGALGRPSGSESKPARPSGRIVPRPPEGFDRAYILPIRDEITDVTLESLQRRAHTARQGGADVIIFELDTPGGMATTALKICTLIKNDLDDIHTVAWVNPDAYSAGALIAMACDEIVMSARSKIGDAQPIMVGPEGFSAVPEDVEPKFTSPLIEELRDSANRHGYDPKMCLAMIRPDIELYWVENSRTGERRFVTPGERDRLFGLETATSTGRTEAIEKKDDEARPRRRSLSEPISDEASRTEWHYVRNAPPLGAVPQPVVPSGELLTMGQDAAIAYGFAKGKVSSEGELRDFLDIRGGLVRLEYTWTEHLVAWLSSPLVRGILFMVMLLAAYVEFNTPGVGLPGIVALVCLVIFLGAPYLTGLAQAWEIVLVVAGVVLLAVEIFVLPGFGVAGISGILLIGVGLLATFMPRDFAPFNWPTLQYTVDGLKTGLWVIALGLLASVAGMVALSRVMPRTPYFRRIIPPNPTPEDVAPDSGGEIARIGDVGRAEGPLRPAGKARFGATLVDVVSDGEFIAPGERVEVIDRAANRVVVRRIRPAT